MFEETGREGPKRREQEERKDGGGIWGRVGRGKCNGTGREWRVRRGGEEKLVDCGL